MPRWMSSVDARTSAVRFKLTRVLFGGQDAETVILVAMVYPGDQGEMVMSIMEPGEE